MDNNIWKDVVGYEGFYKCSIYGEIFSLFSNRNLKGTINADGYIVVKLTKNKTHKIHLLHRLIAETWIENPYNKTQVNHKKGIKTDNRISELEWCTQSENMKHSFHVLGRQSSTKNRFGALCKSSKKVLCINDGKSYDSIKLAAKSYGLKEWAVGSVCNGTQKSNRKNILFKFI